MYIPQHFRVDDREQLYGFIRQYNFGLLLSAAGEGLPRTTWMPFSLNAGAGRLEGHMARANPHWREWIGQPEVSAIFLGPHAYVSPTDYRSDPNVPTWNYVSVRVDGRMETVSEPDLAVEILGRLTHDQEQSRNPKWRLEPESDLTQRLLGAIVCFQLSIDAVYGSFKLNQNKEDPDRRAVSTALLEREYLGDQMCGKFMEAFYDFS